MRRVMESRAQGFSTGPNVFRAFPFSQAFLVLAAISGMLAAGIQRSGID